MEWTLVRTLVVIVILCVLGWRIGVLQPPQALQPYPKLVHHLDSIEFVSKYAQKQYLNLRTAIALFFKRYDETFVVLSSIHRGIGPLPLLYDIKHRVQDHFQDIALRLPSDVQWHLKLQNTCRRILHMLHAYIEDVRERLQLSRYSPDSTEDYYLGKFYGTLQKTTKA